MGRRIVLMKLICSLGRCECDGNTVHRLSQRRLTADWLAPRKNDCSRMHSKVFSAWLPSYIKATQHVLEIFKMSGYFPDSPRMYAAFWPLYKGNSDCTNRTRGTGKCGGRWVWHWTRICATVAWWRCRGDDGNISAKKINVCLCIIVGTLPYQSRVSMTGISNLWDSCSMWHGRKISFAHKRVLSAAVLWT